mmetsp:Transcript_29039/g.74632  ORF Transcript_29039/g.74632 Transcript_29039/m.74632 type:complete len:151 (+) Transcript_29039:27-479(+)
MLRCCLPWLARVEADPDNQPEAPLLDPLELTAPPQKRSPELKPAAAPVTTRQEELSDEMSCSVCMAPYLDGETLRTLPCCHRFHRCCVDPWLARSNTCPICQTDAQRSRCRVVWQWVARPTPSEEADPRWQATEKPSGEPAGEQPAADVS